MALSLTLILPRLVRFGLCLAFCLIAYVVAEEVASPRLNAVMVSASEPGASPDARTDSELSSNDLDDDPLLPILFNLVVLVGWVAYLPLPQLFPFSQRWPPPLRPPHALEQSVYNSNNFYIERKKVLWIG